MCYGFTTTNDLPISIIVFSRDHSRTIIRKTFLCSLFLLLLPPPVGQVTSIFLAGFVSCSILFAHASKVIACFIQPSVFVSILIGFHFTHFYVIQQICEVLFLLIVFFFFLLFYYCFLVVRFWSSFHGGKNIVAWISGEGLYLPPPYFLYTICVHLSLLEKLHLFPTGEPFHTVADPVGGRPRGKVADDVHAIPPFQMVDLLLFQTV
mmetsp:Transcript_29421/g.58349  ORF Transcript_29421/g.58349 Transcript_29421/m.58349 type:complete len:207 (+) Transcript_29421:1296-1916(+)